jgi:hypothetical protein
MAGAAGKFGIYREPVQQNEHPGKAGSAEHDLAPAPETTLKAGECDMAGDLHGRSSGGAGSPGGPGARDVYRLRRDVGPPRAERANLAGDDEPARGTWLTLTLFGLILCGGLALAVYVFAKALAF